MLTVCVGLKLLPESNKVAGTLVRCRCVLGLAKGLSLLLLVAPAIAFAADPVVANTVAANTVPAAAPHAMRPYDFIFGSVQFFLVGLFILWMLYLRPMQKREDVQRKFLADLKKNDDVITSGGIFGKVLTVKPDEVTIEVSPGVKLRVKPDHLYPVVNAQRDQKSAQLQIAGKEQSR